MLVERSSRGLALTPAGQELHTAAERVRSQLSAVTRRLADHNDDSIRGTVRVSFPQILGEPVHGLLAPLTQTHPHVTLELVGDDRRLNLVSGEAEIVLRLTTSPAPDLFGLRLGAMRLGVYASRAYPMAEQPVDASAHRWVDWSTRCRDEPAVEWLAESFPERQIVMTTEHGLGTLNAVRAGMGIGVLPELVATELVHLETLPDDRFPILWLLCSPAVRQRPAVRVVMDALKRLDQAFPTALVRPRSRPDEPKRA